MSEVKMDDIVSLCKRRGFIFQGSEIYGGLAGTWDYGPLGVQLKRNLMNLWWKMFVDEREDMYGVDAAILMNQKTWKASGHVDTFTDPLVECAKCHTRFRVDQIVGQNYGKFARALKSVYMAEFNDGDVAQYDAKHRVLPTDKDKYKTEIQEVREAWGGDQNLAKKISDNAINYEGLAPGIYLNHRVSCPECGAKGQYDQPRQFNMMFPTIVGPNFRINHILDLSMKRQEYEYDTEIHYAAQATSYLRPETAQGIFTNFKNVVDSVQPNLPFGIAQQGKAFRNEISPRDFVFRSREFEQMEIEYFVHPDNWQAEFEKWIKLVHEWCKAIGLPEGSVHELEVPDEDRAHYSKRTIDFEFDFPIGRKELLGLAYRTDFDLGNIQRESGKNMEYRPKDGSTPFVPHVIEPSFGVERAIMAVLVSAYKEDEQNGEKRIYLALPSHLAPVKVAVSPLLKNKPELVAKAREVYDMLKKELGNVMWDDNGNIGKRYRRQDEIGTPYCVTIDFQTLDDNTVTVRNRDTTEQTRINTNALSEAVKV